MNVEFHPFDTSEVPKYPLTVGLVIDDALASYKLTEHLPDGEATIYPLGKPLVQVAVTAAESSFRTVKQMHAPIQIPSGDAVDMIVQCRVLKGSQALHMGMFTTPTQEAILIFEWVFKDPKDGRVIWLKTVEGVAQQHASPSSLSSLESLWRDALIKLWRKSIQGFQESPEIKNFSAALEKK